jgi:hypothetical protein
MEKELESLDSRLKKANFDKTASKHAEELEVIECSNERSRKEAVL